MTQAGAGRQRTVSAMVFQRGATDGFGRHWYDLIDFFKRSLWLL